MRSRVELDEIRGRTGVKSIQSGRKGKDRWVGLGGIWWSQERRLLILNDMVDSRIRGYPPSRWRLLEVFGSNLACLKEIHDSLFYRDD